MMDKETLILALQSAGICHPSEIKGATVEEIAALEEWCGARLPQQYRAFLFAVGRGAGRLFQGTEIFISSVAGLKKYAMGLLEENRVDVQLGDDVFVFSMHQGYEFTYFSLFEGNDPPVYQYIEGNGPPVLTWTSFSEFLRASIAGHAQVKPA